MNRRYFIHILLLVTLCIGQLATNAHIIGHLQFPDGQNEHFDHHPPHHHQHVGFVDLRPSSPREEFNKTFADCGIYHVYIGLNAITAHYSADIGTSSQCAPTRSLTNLNIVTHTTDWHPIRGPPTIS